jgi:hypothetical protein
MLRLVAITALVLAGVSPLARADVFRWVDKDGIVHYSDEWVPGSEVIRSVGKPRPESASAAPSRSATAFNRGETGGETDNARAVQQDVARARDAQCKFSKERYMRSIQSRRVYKEGKDGEREYMSDAEADSYREQARKDVQAACGSVPDWKPDQAIPEPQPIPEPKVKPAEATSP